MVALGLTIGGWFASSVITKLLTVASSYVEDQFAWKMGMKEELRKLEKAFPQIQTIVEAAERGAIGDGNSQLERWLWQFKDAVYEADDVLDELEYLKVQALVHSGGSKVRAIHFHFKNGIMKFSRRAVRRDPMLERLRGAVKRLDDAVTGASKFLELVAGIEQQQQHRIQDQIMSSRARGPLMVESKVFGRSKEIQHIEEWLRTLSNDEPNCSYQNFSVLSIEGIGGVGKTTLARRVYGDTGEDYDPKIWVSVSNNFDVRRVTRDMLEFATKERPKVDSLPALQDILKEMLMSSKKFLLVLDDVWNDNERSKWEELLAPLKNGQKGSKILLTTRMGSVAGLVAQVIQGTTETVKLEGLDRSDFLSLFEQHAFAGVNVANHKKLQSIGEEIAGRLGGSPLAAKTMGGVLNSNLDDRHWTNILKSNIWDLKQTDDDIMPVLRLSYYQLPVPLRACFAICSIFPQDHRFDKLDLIYLWMASGLIEPSQSGVETPEDIGRNYFNILLKKSFFEQNDQYNGGSPCYVMHDLLNDLARFVSLNECFRAEGDMPGNIPVTVRHLSVRTNSSDVIKKVGKLKNLRTLHLSFDDGDGDELNIKSLKKLRSIRVLHIHDRGLTMLPSAVGDFIHLRYLKLDMTSVTSLPKSVSRLYHLQVLQFIKDYHQRQLPYLLPKCLDDLINLRHLILPWNDIGLIAGIGKLTSLQELKRFHFKEERGYKLEELKNMKELRELKVCGLENVKNHAVITEASLKDKMHLRVLELEWTWNEPDVLDSSREFDELALDHLQPHSSISELTLIRYRGARFAVWMGPEYTSSIRNLEYVRLEGCLRWQHLPPLGLLPFLKHLSMQNMPAIKQVAHEFYGTGEVVCFQSLEVLHFDYMGNWEEWSGSVAEAGQWFPCLRDLLIYHCRNLKSLPSLPLNIQELNIHDVGLTSLPAIWQDRGSNSSSTVSVLPLSNLKLIGCHKLTSLAEGFLQHCDRLKSLKSLTIKNCRELVHLPKEGFQNLVSLTYLEISICPKLLTNTVSSNFLPSSLQSLILIHAGDLYMSLSAILQGLTSLSELCLGHCPNMTSLPPAEVVGRLTGLENLRIYKCDKLISLGGLHALHSLRSLKIDQCSALSVSTREEKEEEDGTRPSLDTLSSLEIDIPSSLLAVPLLRGLASLQVLMINDCSTLEFLPAEMEQWLLQNRASLQRFQLYKLLSLQSLPATLQSLTALKELKLFMAHQLQSLPDLPTSLETLEISGCHQVLKERCRKDGGVDWPKIAYISKVVLV